VARSAVDGVVDAVKETGGNAGNAAGIAVTGAIEAAGSIGQTAVRAVKDILLGVVEGVKEVGSAALPRSGASVSAPPSPAKAAESPTISKGHAKSR
jgi:hypothetical protein